MTFRFAVLDGSLRPGAGNTARALTRLARALAEHHVDVITLADYGGTIEGMAERLRDADGLVFGTGTYWASWGSPLQRFFEVMTPFEATDVFVGKPAGVVVTMDATGGAEVASRLIATLVCLGCSAPPFGWMTIPRVGTALSALDAEATADVWGPADLDVLAGNLVTAVAASSREPRPGWRAWSISAAPGLRGPWPASGALPGAAPDFL